MSSKCAATLLFCISLAIPACYAIGDEFSSSLNVLQHNDLTSQYEGACGDQCIPGNTTRHRQCSYIKTCCTDTLGDGALVNYLTMQYCFFNTVQPLGIVVLAVFVLYAFLILGNVADDYFAPTMAELADFLGVSHELAGVTFVAFGNGAPDISSSVAAITQGGDTTKLGLGALLGAAVFDPIAVSGAIAVIVNNPKVARRPFLRDCFFLFIAAGCVLFITSDHLVTLSEALGMVSIYVFYVLSVLLGEIYKKLQKKKRAEAKKRKKQALRPPPETITDKIMPVLGAFSNDSMRDLFRAQKPLNKMPSIQQSPGGQQPAPSLPATQSALNRQESTSFLSRQESAEVPYIQDLYHQLEEEEARERRKSSHHHHHHRKPSDGNKQSQHKQNEHVHDDTHAEDSDSSASSFDDDMSSESSADEADKAWWKVLLSYIIRGPTLLVEILCKITIPLTDKNWNDYIAILSCTTAPIFIQFSFFGDSVYELIGDTVPVALIVGICGLAMSAFTYWRVRRKYALHAAQTKELRKSLLATGNGHGQSVDIAVEESVPTMQSMSGGAASNGFGSHAFDEVNKSALLHSSASILSSQILDGNVNTSSTSVQRVNSKNLSALQEENGGGDATEDGKKQKKKRHGDEEEDEKDKKEIDDLGKQPVMKLFFLMLGFLSAVAWIEIVANELVNLLTTLGVISTIDLALLGLTVLAWGNSIGDMIADVSVSKRGYAKMGISAAIGGPTLNVLIGVGLGTLINTISASDHKDHMPDTSNIFVCCCAVMLGIAIYAVWTAVTKWTLTKAFGYFCFAYYFSFLVINVLVYERIIPLPFGS